MSLVFDRVGKLQISLYLADIPWSKYLKRLENSRQFNIFPSSNRVYQVEIPDSNIKYIINLVDKLCDCKDFYEYQGPCTHAIVVMRY